MFLEFNCFKILANLVDLTNHSTILLLSYHLASKLHYLGRPTNNFASVPEHPVQLRLIKYLIIMINTFKSKMMPNNLIKNILKIQAVVWEIYLL